MTPMRLSPAASCATSAAACALPAASSVAAAVLHAAARVMDSWCNMSVFIPDHPPALIPATFS
jgi:hypothetical protein